MRAGDDERGVRPRERAEQRAPVALGIGREPREHGVARTEHARGHRTAQDVERTPERGAGERRCERLAGARGGRRERVQREVAGDLRKRRSAAGRAAHRRARRGRRLRSRRDSLRGRREHALVDRELDRDERGLAESLIRRPAPGRGTGAGAVLIFSITGSSDTSGMVTRVGKMPPPSANNSTKSQPESKPAAIVSMPESRTIETSARCWPASSRSVLSNWPAEPCVSTTATRPRS